MRPSGRYRERERERERRRRRRWRRERTLVPFVHPFLSSPS
jgi:hypothetical protein